MVTINTVYYEEIKRELKRILIYDRNRELNRILIYECRCNEILRAKAEGSTRLTYNGFLGGLEHHTSSLARVCPTFDLICEENTTRW